MKLHLLSDLHLSVAPFEPPPTDADVVVLAGDIARPPEAIAWARRFDRPVLYVPGNHEFYGGSLDGTLSDLRRLAHRTRIRILDRDAVVIDGVRFLGTTLWTDYALEPDPALQAAARSLATRLVRDYSRIRVRARGTQLFTPAHSAQLFARNAAWLDAQLRLPFDGPTVVLSHHAPSPRSIHPRYADSPLNSCFVSRAERLIENRGIALWVHGHTHDCFDYRIGDTRVLCNPRGYCPGDSVENPDFDPGLVVAL